MRADTIRNAEAARAERAAAAEAAADGAGPSAPPPRAGQSIASKWQDCVELKDYIEQRLASNAAVHKIAAAVSEGNKARWTLLVNAGVAFANGAEDKTIPDWMLPGTFGNRAFPDKVDLALIIGWGRGSPPPTLAQKRRIKIVLVEVG